MPIGEDAREGGSGEAASTGPDGTNGDRATAPVGWPPAADMSLVEGVVVAWRESVFAPRRFFPALGRDIGVGSSILYYLVLGIVVAGVTLFWRMVLPVDPGTGAIAELLALAAPTSPLTDFFFSPLSLLISLFLSAGVVHVLLLILGGAHAGFATTVRVFCFAYSPQLLAVVPIAGSVVGAVWMVVLAIIGLRSAHGTSSGRAAAAVLMPLIVLLFFTVLAVMLLAVGGAEG